MTLPEKRTRPIPPEGLQQAISAGRRRRRLAVAGWTSGVTAAVLAVVVATSAGGSSSASGLEYTDDPSPTAPAGTTPRAPGTSPSPSPRATLALPDAVTSAVPLPLSPTPRSTPTPAPEQVDRSTQPAYTEHPSDTSAPVFCQQPPSAQAGPVVTGGASACAVSEGGPSEVRRGGTWSARYSVCQSHGAGPVDFGFRTGAEHEVLVRETSGELLFRFSASVRYTQGAHHRVLGDGRCVVYDAVWDTRTTDGALVPPGSYDVTVGFSAATADGRELPGEGYAQFPVTVTE